MRGEIDEVWGFCRGLIGGLRCGGGEEETDVGAVEGLGTGAVVGETVAQSDALKRVRGKAEHGCEEAGSTQPDTS